MSHTAPARVGTAPRRRLTLAASSALLVLATGVAAAGASTVPAGASTVTTASVAPTVSSLRSTASDDWDLLSSEEFSRFDRERWHAYDGRESWSGAAKARPWRAFVRDGALRLTSGRDADGRWSAGIVGGWGWSEANRSSGRIDMRVRTDRGPATTTNLMMWPDAQAGLPALDLFTSPAGWAGRQRIQQGSHYRDGAGRMRQRATTRKADATRWRTVSVRWNEAGVTYMVDGTVTRTDTNPALVPGATLWPLLQTTVERDARGRLPRSGRGPTTAVDWIRVYDFDGTPTTPEVPPTETPTPTQPPTTPPTPTQPPTTPPTPTQPPTTPPTPTQPPTPEPSQWVSVGRDDFNGTQLDTSKWSTFSGVPGCCKDTVWDRSQVEVADGELVLHNRQDANGKWLSGGVGGWKWRPTVISEGRIDARLRFDKGTGFSAAALAWPANNTWPPEIDFYEVFETRGNRDKMMQSTHYKDASSSTGRGIDQKSHTGDFSAWKTVSVRWDATQLTYWIDGVKVHTITDPEVIPNTPMWVGFQTHTHKVNGAWPTIPSGQDTVAFRVDWVEVFTKR